MNAFSHVPPGFRFHPTDEELVDYYLRKKVALKKIDLDVIKDVHLYKIEPWDLQEQCKIGSEEQNEWYFFSHKDKKYPTGTRTNRATTAGFWKATGRDKPIYVKRCLVGMRKTLVFYKGRAPNGQKLDWIMHEYRLETNENAAPREEGWVVCRVFKKRVATVQRMAAADPPFWLMAPEVSPRLAPPPPLSPYHSYHHPCKVELEYHHHLLPQEPGCSSFLQLPQLELESPKLLPGLQIGHVATLQPCGRLQQREQHETESVYAADASAVDCWRDLDKFVASHLISNGDGESAPKVCGYSDPAVQVFHVEDKQEHVLDYLSTPASCAGDRNDLWK